jgi:hypothetical protein
MNEPTFEQLQSIDARFERDVSECFDYDRSVEMRSARGGTSKSCVLEQIMVLREMLKTNSCTVLVNKKRQQGHRYILLWVKGKPNWILYG